jgi:hypothetical protein
MSLARKVPNYQKGINSSILEKIKIAKVGEFKRNDWYVYKKRNLMTRTQDVKGCYLKTNVTVHNHDNMNGYKYLK